MEELGKRFCHVTMAVCWSMLVPVLAEAGLVTTAPEAPGMISDGRISAFLQPHTAKTADFSLFHVGTDTVRVRMDDGQRLPAVRVDTTTVFFLSSHWPDVEFLQRSVVTAASLMNSSISSFLVYP